MKNLPLILLCLFSSSLFSQSDTEIFLFEVETSGSKIEIKNGKNISKNKGYDSQPSFLDERYIIFASTKNNQTDIAKFDLKTNSKTFLNATEGGEYTPLKIPNRDAISAVRLDKDGKQRLYAYNLSNGESTELIKDLVIAYYTWYNEDIIVSAVIENDQLNLYRINLKEGTNKKFATNVGRSFHKIPNSKLISFISKENENQWQIKSFNPTSGAIKLIANTVKGVEDICWLNKTNLLSSKGSVLYKLTLQKDYNWKKIANLYNDGIEKITRLATNPKGSKLLVTGDVNSNYNTSKSTDITTNINEEKAAQIVQKHIEPFNNKDLNAFSNAFNEDITVNRFPAENMYSGREKLKENYKDFFKKNEKSNVKVLSRMTLNNVVIDEELVTIDNTTKRQVTIYETDANGINSMTFIGNSKIKKKSEKIINERLKTHNEKDIKAFGRTYSKNVEVYLFPNTLKTEGRSALREDYILLFENTPDLDAEIVNRIIIGNKIIDKQKVTINKKAVYSIAIYEISNNLISRVTVIE